VNVTDAPATAVPLLLSEIEIAFEAFADAGETNPITEPTLAISRIATPPRIERPVLEASVSPELVLSVLMN
jgi:hypothetical protein